MFNYVQSLAIFKDIFLLSIVSGGFKVNMKRHATNTRSIVCWYEPTEAGQYVVNVLWSGVHIPNSPFTVNIYETLEELQKVTGKLIGTNDITLLQDNSQWTEDI